MKISILLVALWISQAGLYAQNSTEETASNYPAENQAKLQFTELNKNQENSNSINKEVPKDTLIEKQVNQFEYDNTNCYNYLFLPTAFGVPKDTGYYQNQMIGINAFHYGITDYFSIGGGVEFISSFLISALSGEMELIGFIRPKLNYELSDKWHIGGGVTFIFDSRDILDENFMPFVTTTLTYGSKDRNISVGGLYQLNKNFIYKHSLYVSGMYRLNNRLVLLNENAIITYQEEDCRYVDEYNCEMIWESSSFLSSSLGLRFNGKKGAFDLGINMDNEESEFKLRYPYLGYMRKF